MRERVVGVRVLVENDAAGYSIAQVLCDGDVRVWRFRTAASVAWLFGSRTHAASVGVRTISAPRARSITSFSSDILAGKVMMHLYPLMAQARARPIPVFPPIVRNHDIWAHVTVVELTSRLDDHALAGDEDALLLSVLDHTLPSDNSGGSAHLGDTVLDTSACRHEFGLGDWQVSFVGVVLVRRLHFSPSASAMRSRRIRGVCPIASRALLRTPDQWWVVSAVMSRTARTSVRSASGQRSQQRWARGVRLPEQTGS